MNKKETTKLKWFARPPKFVNRMVMMIIGVLIQGLGLSLMIQIDMGTDPCSSLTLGIINYIPLSFGTCQLLCHLITFAFVVKYDMSYIGYGTIGNMVFLGYISDFYTWIWSWLLPEGLHFFEQTQVRYILLLPALALLVVGAATYMTAGLGSSPYDAIPFVIANRCKKFSFRTIRMVWDFAFTLGGFLLGGAAGVITVLVALFMGPVVEWIGKRLQRFIG